KVFTPIVLPTSCPCFFFQAEDGIRYYKVTGVQTCALPISARLNKFVASAVVLGDQRKFPIILIVPNFDQLERWATERNLTYASQGELIRLADVQAKMEREVMGGLRDLAKFEMPKKVVLIERDFTIESGEMN